jgi:hypothetical protein
MECFFPPRIINPANPDFEDGRLAYKIKLHTKDKREACQLTKTKVQQQQKNTFLVIQLCYFKQSNFLDIG